MRLALIPTFGAAALIALAQPLSAAPVRFDADPPHSQVSFSIRHFFSHVSGRFNDVAATIMLDEQNLANSSVEATIQAASIFTNNEYRDRDLRSPNFFAVDSSPALTFKSTKVTPGENGRLEIDGDLTMRGITKPIVLDGAFLGAGALDMKEYSAGYRAGFEASTTLNRKDWNIVWNKTLDQGGTMLGDEVAITIGIEAIRFDPNKAGAGKKPGKN